MPDFIKRLLANIHDEVLAKYYGCGLVAPLELTGARILDLGCGSGRDVYALAQLVGIKGEVVGVDMTPEQIGVARKHADWHVEKFGFKKPNVRFLDGYIEKLDELDLQPESFDIIVSNCVINLSVDKPAVLRGAYELLKPGGELYFADVYADRRLPDSVRADPVLYGECLGGALYWNDFHTLAQKAGFTDPRLVEDRPLGVNNAKITAKLGAAKFFSATYRLGKSPNLEDYCEDYGLAIVYGAVALKRKMFSHWISIMSLSVKSIPRLRQHLANAKTNTLAKYFDFIGDFSRHYGIFTGCGTSIPFDASKATPPSSSSNGGGCC